MPNHVTNIIKADGEVLDVLKGCRISPAGWQSFGLEAHYCDVDFNTVIPQPSNTNIGSENFERIPPGKISWYDWNTSNWGTKWNAYQVSRPKWDEVRFQTAWAHPTPVILALSLKFPRDVLRVKYADEDTGYNLGSYRAINGTIVGRDKFIDGSDEACEFACQVCYGRTYAEMKGEWGDNAD